VSSAIESVDLGNQPPKRHPAEARFVPNLQVACGNLVFHASFQQVCSAKSDPFCARTKRVGGERC
jgi:hypothetical protein